MRHPQRLFGRMQLRLTEACRGDLGARRQGRQRKDIGDDSALDLEPDRSLDARNRNRRVRRKALPNPLSVRDGELAGRGLQSAIVEERDLYRGIGGQWS